MDCADLGDRSPCRPIADSLHYYLNDGCKLSLDDTFGNRLAVDGAARSHNPLLRFFQQGVQWNAIEPLRGKYDMRGTVGFIES